MSARAPAYEHNGRRVGRERFYEIACDPRRSCAVEACAGAGKTWMLVSRIVRALLTGAKPHEILAITFTRKAAGEMRNRLQEWLSAWSRMPAGQLAQELAMRGLPGADEATCEALRELYRTMLAAGRPVQVRTFHSWFAALLGGAPLSLMEQLGLPARYELLLNDQEAVSRVWRRFHLAVARDANARRDYEASVAAHGRFQTRKALATALEKRVEFARADEYGAVESAVKPAAEQFPEFAAAARPEALFAIESVRSTLLDAARALGRASAVTIAAKGSDLERAVADRDLAGVLGALLTDKREPRKLNDKLPGIEDVRRAQDLALRLLAFATQHEGWEHHLRIARLTRLLLAQFAALKREQGWIDMNDVERAALEMLSNPVLSGWVQERLDQQVKHLLIDEFQDTNPMQWLALSQWLGSYAGAGGHAPSVFIVGDPKQSIYRFRRAEPQVFRAAQKFIVESLGGDRLSCDHTFRNSPDVLEAVNAVFDAAQRGYEFSDFRAHTTESVEPGQVACLPQVPREPRAQRDKTPGALEWRDSLTVPRETPEERLITLECRQAAAWIAGEIARGTKPGHIMVLSRKRERLVEMEQQLRALHIPSQQPENTDLAAAPEVQDVAALLDVLVTTSHDLSLARALRSPIFSVGDEGLVELATRARAQAAEGPARSWFELLQASEDWSAPLASARAQLLAWKAALDRLPPHDALEIICQGGDLLAKFAAASPAPLREVTLANLRALLGAALDVEGGRYLTPYAFVRALKAGGIQGPAVAAEGVVKLLTVHGAKGLEAPVVVLLDADPSATNAETMSVLCEWPGESPAPWRFAFIANEARPPACSEAHLRAEEDERRREEMNGLYVAMTRAGRRLVLSSVEPIRRSETTWWERVQPLAESLPPPEPAAPAAARDAAPFELRVMPRVEVAAPTEPARQPDSEYARFGSAVHRLLEHALAGDAPFPPARLRRVAREFLLDAAQLDKAVAMAGRILTGEGAWAWDPGQVDAQGNEVELFHQGELLRMDRLVRRAGRNEWWVLDYKSAAAPQARQELVAQMRRYCEAVGAAYPGATVRAAFLTGEGRLVALD